MTLAEMGTVHAIFCRHGAKALRLEIRRIVSRDILGQAGQRIDIVLSADLLVIVLSWRIADSRPPRRPESLGILHQEIDANFVLSDFSVAFDHPKPIRMGRSQIIDPSIVGQSDGIDDERIAFPMPDGMAVGAPPEIVGMGGIHVDNALTHFTRIKDYKMIGRLQKLHRIVEL